MKFSILIAGFLLTGISAMAQDTLRKKQVNITSTFKPSLKEAAKINLNATPPTADTSRPKLQYNIPNQNLSFAFQPGTLKPLALQVDTGGRWDNESYVKLGYGNLKTPYLQAGLSFGDGKTAGLNLYAKHSSSTGKINLQDYSNTAVEGNGFFQTGKNIEWNARFGGYEEKYNKYGFEPRTLAFPDDSLKVKFQTLRGRISFHNINKTDFGLSYAPELKVDVFNDRLSNSESNTYVNLPLEKTLGQTFAVDLALTANLTRYKPEKKDAVANNYFAFSPSILFKKPNINIQAGLRPSWDNKEFILFPNVLAEFNTTDKQVSFQLGWSGYLRNSGYQYLAGYNPWIWAPSTIYNTRIEERFAGFKGSVGDHFNYSAKVAYNTLTNQPLFVNDTVSGKSFAVINEPKINQVHFGGEIGYTVGEKFSVISNLSINNYKAKENAKAWGLLPLEWKTDLRLQVLKDLYVNSTLFAFDGPWSLTKAGRKNLGSAMDLSAGLEFKVVKNVKLWAQFNNILNREYQRWNQYPVYGFNFLGGVVFSFAQKNKSAGITD
jgi:hypothetical protein